MIAVFVLLVVASIVVAVARGVLRENADDAFVDRLNRTEGDG